MKENRDVSIIILNYKSWAYTIRCLESLFEITYPRIRVIIVDNDSQDKSLKHIEEWLAKNGKVYAELAEDELEAGDFIDHRLVMIQSSSNRGYAAGNNIGLRWAVRADVQYCLILNNDTIVDKGFLEPLVELLEYNDEVALAGPLLRGLHGSIESTCARKQPGFLNYFFRTGPAKRLWPNNPWSNSKEYVVGYEKYEPFQVDVISGSCMLIRRDFLEKIGYLDENTFLFAEEYILAEQVRKQNKLAYLVPRSNVIHIQGASTKNKQSSYIYKCIIESHQYYLRHYRQKTSVLCFFYLFWPRIYFFNAIVREFISKRKQI